MGRALRVLLIFIALVIALIVAFLLWPTDSDAEEHEVAPPLEIVEERLWLQEDFDFDDAVERARRAEGATRSEPRSVAESATIEDEMFDAALRLHPSLKRRPQHVRRVVSALFEASVEHDVDPFLTLAFASRESGLRANARGALGEQGLLQLHGYARRVCGKGRDLGQPRVNADAGLCWYGMAREKCETTDVWVATAAYGTGRCLSAEAARRLPCTKRKRAELVKAVGEERASMIWPEG